MDDKDLKVVLRIEDDEEFDQPYIVLGFDSDGQMLIQGANFSTDNTGATAVASMLHAAADALDRALVEAGHAPSAASAPPVKHPPRFNPRPAGAQS